MSNSKLFSLIAAPSLLLAVLVSTPSNAAPLNTPMVIASEDHMNMVPNNIAPDNSATNARDRSDQEPTADQGGNKVNDRDIMQKIRKNVMADKSLSTYAHNVKIISQNGKVTLKGPVQSEQEKQNIDAKAKTIAGEGNIVDKLSITSTQ